MSAPQPTHARDTATGQGEAPPAGTALTCPPFTPARLGRHLALDLLGRVLAIAAVATAIVIAAEADQGEVGAHLMAAALIAGVWWLLGWNSARTWRSLPGLTAMLDEQPELAEGQLATALGRWPLQRSIRLMLYHRLAGLRYRQQRFAEAADICAALLARRAVILRPLRAGLLLMLVEARLRLGQVDLAGEGLAELEHVRLGTLEALQRLSAQTRYQLMTGRHAAALEGFEHKVRTAELMPGPQCGAVHALLSVAAAAHSQHELAAWLRQRAELLCTPQQLAQTLAAVGEARTT